MKAIFHKSCSCRTCKRGRATAFGQAIHKANEHKLRQSAKRALSAYVKAAEKESEVMIVPIASPYTD